MSNQKNLFTSTYRDITVKKQLQNFSNYLLMNIFIVLYLFKPTVLLYKKQGVVFKLDLLEKNLSVYNLKEYLFIYGLLEQQLIQSNVRKLQACTMYSNKFTVQEIACVLKVNLRTVYKYIKK